MHFLLVVWRLASEDACYSARGDDACTGLRPCQPQNSYNIIEMAHQGSSPKHGTPCFPCVFLLMTDKSVFGVGGA